MARISSKYFASVIAKFLEAKRKEDIVVDARFKEQLKQNIIERASGIVNAMPRLEDEFQPVQPEEYSELTETLPDHAKYGFADFVRKWRYLLAIVPSALLVTIVTIYIMKLPVSVPTEVKVPVSQPQVEEQPKVQEQPQVQEQPKVQEQQGTTEQGTSNVQTKEPDQTAPVKRQTQPKQPTTEQVQPETQVTPEQNVQTQNDKQQWDNFLRDIYILNFLNRDSQVTNPALTAPAVISPQADQNLNNEPAANDQNADTLRLKSISLPKVGAGEAQQDQNETKLNVEAVPGTREPLNLDVETGTNFPVYYYSNFSADEKTRLKTQILDSLPVRDVIEAKVFVTANDIVEVDVLYKDGSVKVSYYRQNVGSGYFDPVTLSNATTIVTPLEYQTTNFEYERI